MSYLLDTNVVSEWAKPRPEPGVVRWLAEVDEDRVFLSVITIAELQRGVDLLPPGRKRERLHAWLARDIADRFEDRILDVTRDIARQWGTICAEAQRKGHTLSVMDAFVAATAAVHGMTIVTRNGSDVAATGVDVLNPWTTAL